MESSLEWLPNELLDPILADLAPRDMARLARCSRRLRPRLEAELYRGAGAITRAVEFGAKTGNIDCLRAAMRHGSSGFDVFALSLAARKGQDGAFAFMLGHGGGVAAEGPPARDDAELRHQVVKLMGTLGRARGVGMLRLFYGAGLDMQARGVGLCPQAVWPLDRVIAQGGPGVMERVCLVLARRGVRLDRSWPNSGSLISTAVAANLPDVVNFLVARGVDIHGREGDNPEPVSRSRDRFCHIPVFAAAQEMARSDHGLAMMRLVLQHGADINHRGKVRHWARVGSWVQTYDYYYTTPLFTFLDSVRSWKDGSRPDVIAGLEFLTAHGALTRVPGMEAREDVFPPCEYTKTPLLIYLLLQRWGLQTLNRPRFLAAFRFLVKREFDSGGLPPEEVATIVQRFGWVASVDSPANAKGRGLLLDVLLEGRAALESTEVLNRLSVKAGYPVDELWKLYKQVVDSLIAAGATMYPKSVSDGSGGRPA